MLQTTYRLKFTLSRCRCREAKNIAIIINHFVSWTESFFMSHETMISFCSVVNDSTFTNFNALTFEKSVNVPEAHQKMFVNFRLSFCKSIFNVILWRKKLKIFWLQHWKRFKSFFNPTQMKRKFLRLSIFWNLRYLCFSILLSPIRAYCFSILSASRRFLLNMTFCLNRMFMRIEIWKLNTVRKMCRH